MTEIVIKIKDDLAKFFKEVSQKKFHGDDTQAFEHALKLLLSREEKQMHRFQKIMEQIHDEIDTAGGISESEIDSYISEHRQKHGLSRQ